MSEHSSVICKSLKKRGWIFLGPTMLYAFMQAMAMAMANDHLEGCYKG